MGLAPPLLPFIKKSDTPDRSIDVDEGLYNFLSPRLYPTHTVSSSSASSDAHNHGSHPFFNLELYPPTLRPVSCSSSSSSELIQGGGYGLAGIGGDGDGLAFAQPRPSAFTPGYFPESGYEPHSLATLGNEVTPQMSDTSSVTGKDATDTLYHPSLSTTHTLLNSRPGSTNLNPTPPPLPIAHITYPEKPLWFQRGHDVLTLLAEAEKLNWTEDAGTSVGVNDHERGGGGGGAAGIGGVYSLDQRNARYV